MAITKHLFLLFLFMKPFVSTEESKLYNLNNVGYLYSYPKECYEILTTFANYASNFTLCSILYARPIRLCEQCVDNYVLLENKYQELVNTKVNGTSCGSLFMSKDRLNIIQKQYDSAVALWTMGNCKNCFDWTNNKPNLNNNTITFNKMNQTTINCICKNANLPNNSVCELCMDSYIKLDEFYKSLSDDSIGVETVCMDIVDSMNATRSIWSKTLNCCNLRRSPEIIFLVSASIISFLPILFYLSVRYCGPIRHLPNVLKQSGFKQTILRTVAHRND